MFLRIAEHKAGARKPRGVTTLALIAVLAFFVILPLTLFGFELSRYILMQQQLQACVDSAALSGTAALASSPQGLTLPQQHTTAMTVAGQTFALNTILQTALNQPGAVTVNMNSGWNTSPPPVRTAVLNIRLLNQNGGAEATGSPNATSMRIEGRYSDAAIFTSSIFPIGTLLTAVAVSDGGLPRLDLFLCFDVSGSIDDETNVVFVRRYWDGTQMRYTQVDTGSIFARCQPPKDGTGLNAPRPQNLSFASYGWNGQTGNQTVHTFSDTYFGANPPDNPAIQGLRANRSSPAGVLIAEQGRPPGNYDASNPSVPLFDANVDADGFTDMIVQVPNVGPFTFPNIQTCVEASRGNLENPGVYATGHPGPADPSIPAPQAGYYAAYWSQVTAVSEPIATARGAAVNFFDTMNVSSNAHFGFVSFTDVAGTSAAGTYANPNIDGYWPEGGTGAFPLPLVNLNQGQSNYQQVKDAITGVSGSPPIGPLRQTNLEDPLDKALDDLTDNTKRRALAKRAVILFTDGIPNRYIGWTPPANPPSDLAQGEARAYNQANRARGAGIPIYTIGLSQNPNIITDMDRVLGDNRNGTPQGIAFKSGNNAIYVRVGNAAGLNAAFQTIARSLVVLQ